MNEGTIKPFQNDSCVQFYLESFSDYYLHAVDVTHADLPFDAAYLPPLRLPNQDSHTVLERQKNLRSVKVA